MKINEQTRFPHPVLSADTGDYLAGEFSIELTVAEMLDSSRVTFDHRIKLDEPNLQRVVASDHAGVGIFVSCRDTYFSSLIPLGLAGGQFAFEPGALLGRVSVRPMIWSRREIAGYPLAACHAEFGGGKTDFAPGAVLALDQEVTIHVGREKLAQMETIFTIVSSESLPAGELAIDLDADKIRIMVASDIYQKLNTLRGLGHGKSIVLNSVYLPAVMQVLDSLRDGGAYEDRRWYRVFEAKCTHLSIDIASSDLWRDGQRLLQSPFRHIAENAEILGG